MNNDFVRRYIDFSMFKTKKLSPYMKYYRILGFCYYDNSGQPKLIYKAYCFGIFVLHCLLISFLVSTYTPGKYFKLKNAVQRLPFFLKQLGRVTHVLISTICILKNNPLIKDFYTCISCIRCRIKSTKQESHSDLFYCLVFSLPQLCLVFILSITFAIELGDNSLEKIDTFLVFMLTFPVYVMEEWLTQTMLASRNTLIKVNQVFRECPPTAQDVKNFRTIHSQLAVLSFQINDHFCLMVTTWVATSTMIVWASAFQIIQIFMYVDNPTTYLLVTFSVDILHHLTKMITVCHYCETIKKEVSWNSDTPSDTANILNLLVLLLQQDNIKIRIHELEDNELNSKQLQHQVKVQLFTNTIKPTNHKPLNIKYLYLVKFCWEPRMCILSVGKL